MNIFSVENKFLLLSLFDRLRLITLMVVCSFLSHSLFAASPEGDLKGALPVKLLPVLSGNFGELRPNHFHSGIDFKTNGVIGHDIVSFAEGYVSKIGVSGSGYGKVVYVNHPSGLTTVYAHLDRFSPLLDSVVRFYQYKLETFALSIDFSEGQLLVQRGQLLGYSGNTGSSAGPHLHFEVRRTETDCALNPLSYLPDFIKDKTPPRIYGMMLTPCDVSSSINEKSSPLLVLTQQKRVKPIKAWGRLMTSVSTLDFMDQSSNKFGVHKVDLFVDDFLVFTTSIDSVGLEHSSHFNAFIDYGHWVNHRSFYIQTVKQKGNRLSLYPNEEQADGVLNIDEERDYKIKFHVYDFNGNRAVFATRIRGERCISVDSIEPDTKRIMHHEAYLFEEGGLMVNFPQGAFFDDQAMVVKTLYDTLGFAEVYAIHDRRVPLAKPLILSLSINPREWGDISKMTLVNTDSKRHRRVRYLSGEGKVSVQINECGNYALSVDTVPPSIQPLSFSKTMASFRVLDRESGIKQCRTTLDGLYILSEYDAKTQRITLHADRKRFGLPQERFLEVKVEDNCGNSSVYQKKIVI